MRDTYNKFCVDCNAKETLYANISYGTFLCDDCAKQHLDLYGMSSSYIKPIFNSVWDSYQMQVATHAKSGNKVFWDFMKQYENEQRPISEKYRQKSAQYYKQIFAATIQGKDFNEVAPPRNTEEAIDRGVNTAKIYTKKAGEQISIYTRIIDAKIDESGIKNKVKDMLTFNK